VTKDMVGSHVENTPQDFNFKTGRQ